MNAHSTTLMSDTREILTKDRSQNLTDEYASLIKRYALLEQPREQQLAQRWQEHRDRSATDALVTSHLRLAAKVARRYQRDDLPLADLIGEANLGLVIAASHFEPGRGARFSTYALWWIKAAIHSNFGGWLTSAELQEIGEQLLAMWRPYLDRLADRAERPEGARLVHMFAHGFPRADALDMGPGPLPDVADPDGEPDGEQPADTDPRDGAHDA